MKIPVTQVVNFAFDIVKETGTALGYRTYKNSLPKDIKQGLVVTATDITFDDNQQAILFVLAYIPDVISRGNYEHNGAEIDRVAAYFAQNLESVHVQGTSYRMELDGQSVENGDDGNSHVVSNRFLFTFNAE